MAAKPMGRDVAVVSIVCFVLLVGGCAWLACLLLGWEAGAALSMAAVGWIGLTIAAEKRKSDAKASK